MIQGKDLVVKSNGIAFAASRSCSINVSAKDIERASDTNGQWSFSIIGKKSWSITTNHMLMSIGLPMSVFGTTVDIEVSLPGNLGLSFSGFVDNMVITSGSFSGGYGALGVFWDKTKKKFLLKVRDPFDLTIAYYESWSGVSVPDSSAYVTTDGTYFNSGGISYIYANGVLYGEKLTGQAHVLTWKTTGTVQNLAQGSFELKGNGPLTPT